MISREYMFFGTRNPNLKSILKPKVELIVFLRMLSNKNMKKRQKMSLQCRLKA